MARIILALSWRQTLRSLTRSAWTIVGVVVGLLYALGAVTLVFVFSVVGRLFADVDTIRNIVAIAGLAAWAIWLVIAFVIGLQESTGPEQLSLLPVTPRDLTFGLFLSGLLGITGIAFALSLLGLWIVWSGTAITLIAAILVSPFAITLWFLLTRLITDGLASRTKNRRVRDTAMVILFLLAVSAGVLLQFVIRAIEKATVSADVVSLLGQVGSIVQWLPPVAPVAVPGAIAAGEYLTAAGLTVITLGSTVLAWQLWSRMLTARLTAPIQSSGGSAAHDGTWIDNLFPATAWGGVAARRVRYFLRDSRHQMNIATSFILLIFVFVWTQFLLSPELGKPAAIFAPLLVCVSILSIAQMELAYDGEALAGDQLAGITGRADRLGRAMTIALIFVPLVLVATLVTVLSAGVPEMLPAALGINIGGALVAIGVGLAVGTLLPGTAPPPGGNPFGKGSSGDIQNFLGTLIGIVACCLLNGLALGFGIAAFWVEWAGYVSLLAGIPIGIGVIVLSVRVSARWFERRAPENLKHIRKTA
ncbi:MAG: hypothetical protein ACTJFR_00890 [Canibacter sp.]